MGGLAGYITEIGTPDLHRVQLLKALPAVEGEAIRFCSEDTATFLYAGQNSPITQRRGNRTLSAVLSGNLSDAAALRDQLRQRGHPVYTGSDAELVLISYIEWGADAPEHFSGDFALAVWNGEELLLARSPSGRKALYFMYLDGFPFFATDPAVLFAHPNLPLRLSPQGAVNLLCPTEKTIGGTVLPEGIEALQPGEFFLRRPGQTVKRAFVNGISDCAEALPVGDFSDAFEKRLGAVLSACRDPSECFLTLGENDFLAEWLHSRNGNGIICRKPTIWEAGDRVCPDAIAITGEEAALGLTELVTTLGRADFTPDEAAAFQLCRKLRKSFSGAVSTAGGHLLPGGSPERPIALPTKWLVPELQEIASIPTKPDGPEQLLQRNLKALFERNDRLASHAGLRLRFPFADPELLCLCRSAARPTLAGLPHPSPRFWPHPDGRGWAHGIESRFRALLSRADAPIWQLCRRDALPVGEIDAEIMAKLVTAGHWLEHFRIAPR